MGESRTMSVQLTIEDGNPWYLSQDIWTVPQDPEGPPGPPISGEPCFLWARVRNQGDEPVSNATVRFYWANPSVGFNRNTANFIGNAYVSLEAGANADVLCLTPWMPVYVNGGHECVLAEVFHASDPLPFSPNFNVPTDRHVAQRNLSLVMTTQQIFYLPFEVHNPARIARVFKIWVQQGKLSELEGLQRTLGSDVRLPNTEGHVERLTFLRKPYPLSLDYESGEPSLDVEVPPKGRVGLTLAGRLSEGGALLHVLQQADDVVLGGLSALVLSGAE
jgi:hypothetical protein